jgi:hypothetical protein
MGSAPPRTPGESVPLWPLVYHDSVLSFRGTWDAVESDSQAATQRRCLENMLWGCHWVFGGFDAPSWPRLRTMFAATLHVDEFLARVGTAELTAHRFLSEDHQMEMSEFSSGQAIVVNFAAEARTAQRRTIAPGSYAILD